MSDVEENNFEGRLPISAPSERPRLRRNRRRRVCKGESLEVEGGTSPVKWLVNDRSDP